MKNRLLISFFIVALGIFSCENNKQKTQDPPGNERTNAIGVQGTELEETSNSSETTDPDRTDPKHDTISFKEQNEKK